MNAIKTVTMLTMGLIVQVMLLGQSVIHETFDGNTLDSTLWQVYDGTYNGPETGLDMYVADSLFIVRGASNNNNGSYGILSNHDYSDIDHFQVDCWMDALHNWQDHSIRVFTPLGIWVYYNFQTTWKISYTDSSGNQVSNNYDNHGYLPDARYSLDIERLNDSICFSWDTGSGYIPILTVPDYSHLTSIDSTLQGRIALLGQDKGVVIYDNLIIEDYGSAQAYNGAFFEPFNGNELDSLKWDIYDMTYNGHESGLNLYVDDTLFIVRGTTNNNNGEYGIITKANFLDYDVFEVACWMDALHNWQDHPVSFYSPLGSIIYRNVSTDWRLHYYDQSGTYVGYSFNSNGYIPGQKYRLKLERTGDSISFYWDQGIGYEHIITVYDYSHLQSPAPVTYGKVYLINSDKGTSKYDNLKVIDKETWQCGDTLTDPRDGNMYSTTLIGSQCWMAQNLDFGTFVLGVNEHHDNDTTEKFCYDDSLINCQVYGALYQWEEAMDYSTTEGTQGICPPGWRLPTDNDWNILEGAVDSRYAIGDHDWTNYGFRGYDAAGQLKDNTLGLWLSPNSGATNRYGFSSLPGGAMYDPGNFSYAGHYGIYWSSTSAPGGPFRHSMDFNRKNIYRWSSNPDGGLSVRCISSDPYPCSNMPNQAIAGTDILNHTSLNVQLGANNPVNCSGRWKVISGNGGSFSNDTLPNAVFTGTNNTTYVLEWTHHNLCSSNRDSITVSLAPPAAEVTISMDTVSTCGSSTFDVPILISASQSIGSFSITLDYDTSAMEYQGYCCTHANLSSGILLLNESAGSIIASFVSLSPVNDLIGTLFTLQFTGLNTISSQLEWQTASVDDCQFTDTIGQVLNSEFTNGLVDLQECYNLSGQVRYANSNQTPLHGTIIELQTEGGNVLQLDTTDMTGYYQFNDLTEGSYQLKVVVNYGWDGGNGSDALQILRHFAELSPLTGITLGASDVNASGFTNSVDALAVMQRFVKIINSFPSGDWYYQKSALYVLDNLTYNVDMLCFGDVNASYTPGSTKQSDDIELVREGELQFIGSDIIEIPLSFDRSLELGSVSFELNLIPGNMEFVDISSEILLTESLVYSIDNNKLRLVWASLNPVKVYDGEALLQLKVQASGTVSDPDFFLSDAEITDILGNPLETKFVVPNIIHNGKPMSYQLFPNPAQHSLYLNLDNVPQTAIKYAIYDIGGKKASEGSVLTSVEVQQININNLKAGIYIFELRANDKYDEIVDQFKLIIMK